MEKLENDNLAQIISDNKYVIAMFGAGWCGACQNALPVFEELSKHHENIKFVFIDADKSPNSRKLVKITAIPMFILYNDGAVLYEQATSRKDRIENLITHFPSENE
jgi:thiol-disulfide isomerase/thioredoxin